MPKGCNLVYIGVDIILEGHRSLHYPRGSLASVNRVIRHVQFVRGSEGFVFFSSDVTEEARLKSNVNDIWVNALYNNLCSISKFDSTSRKTQTTVSKGVFLGQLAYGHNEFNFMLLEPFVSKLSCEN